MSQMTPTKVEITKLAREFILHGDQVKAWRKTYPKSKASLNVQYSKSSTAFSSEKVKERIKQLQEISRKNSEEEFTMTVSDLKKVLATAVKLGLKTKTDVQGNIVAHNLNAAVAAVREFNSMDGNHAPAKTDMTINPSDLTPWGSVTAGVDKNDNKSEE